MSGKAIWLKNPDVLRRFNHWKLDHGNDSDIAITELMDIVGVAKVEIMECKL